MARTQLPLIALLGTLNVSVGSAVRSRASGWGRTVVRAAWIGFCGSVIFLAALVFAFDPTAWSPALGAATFFGGLLIFPWTGARMPLDEPGDQVSMRPRPMIWMSVLMGVGCGFLALAPDGEGLPRPLGIVGFVFFAGGGVSLLLSSRRSPRRRSTTTRSGWAIA